MGGSFAHLYELPRKLELSPAKYLTVQQMAQFDMALDGGLLLPDAWYGRIFNTPAPGGAGDYRWGWFVQN